MNGLDKAISLISPKWALARVKSRQILSAYEAAQPGRHRKTTRSGGSGDVSVRQAAQPIREIARHLDENHDLAKGVLDTLIANVVGPYGISVEPQPRRNDGSIHDEFSAELQELFRDFSLKPEVTQQYNRAATERLAALSWIRDGECFGQHLAGHAAGLVHGTRIPYSIELMEADYVPLDHSILDTRITQGIEHNAWGRPTRYWVYKEHPAGTNYRGSQELKAISAENMLHLKHVRRINQTRGISMLASVITRLEDVKDYEESERVAARIAAAMAFYIRKDAQAPYSQGYDSEDEERHFQIAPGIIWDNLLPGEEVGSISSNRPSQLLEGFRKDMLRAISAGTAAGYSSISKDYNGSYSSQRQELVEQFAQYNTLTADFINQWCRPIYLKFLQIAIATRLLVVPKDLNLLTLDDAEFRGPVMPWVDPQKEATANLTQVQAGFKSISQVIRERGGVPKNVLNEIEAERKMAEDKELVFVSDYKHDAKSQQQGMNNGEMVRDQGASE